MAMIDRSHDEAMIKYFREDPAFALELLNDILNDGDEQGELRVLLRQMSSAFGGGSDIFHDPGDLIAAVRAMGLRLSVTPIQPKPRRRAKAAKANTPKRAAAPRVRRPAAKFSAAPVA